MPTGEGDAGKNAFDNLSYIYSDYTGFLNWKKKLYVRHTCALGIKGTKRRLAVKNFLEIFLRSKYLKSYKKSTKNTNESFFLK